MTRWATTAPTARGLRLCVLLLLCLAATTARAQVRRLPSSGSLGNTGATVAAGGANPFATADSTQADSTAVQGLEYNTEVPDSVLRRKVFFFRYRPTQVWLDRMQSPTLDPTGAQFLDPLDALNGNYYLGKGSLGHQHIGLFPTLADGLAMQLQPGGYEGLYKTPENINLYQTLTPYTVLAYGSSLNKDYGVRASHTQNIMPGWNAAFDYRLFSPEGVYTSSGAVNNYLDATTNYFSPDARLQAVAGIIWHKFRIEENGGITNDSIFTQRQMSNLAGVPVNLDGNTVERDLRAFGHATYSLERQSVAYRQRDSISLRVVDDSTTVADTLQVTDTLELRTPRILNAGVVGLEVDLDRRKRVFEDSTLWRSHSATLFWTNDAYADHRWRNPLKLTAGISPQVVTAVIEADTLRHTSLLNPFARAEVGILRGSLAVEGRLQGSMLDEQTPDSRIAATLHYPLDSARTSGISLSAVAQHRSPDVRMIYDASTKQELRLKPLATERYRLQFNYKEYIDLDLRTSHLDHNTWYASDGSVVEGTRALWLTQASVTLRLAVGPVHLDMQQLLQHSTDSVQMPVPLWASKNSLYADFLLFRRLLRVQVGVDVRYHTPFFAPAYDPYTGLFRHQEETTVGGYLWGDAFVNLQVKRASIYLKAGHLNALWDEHPAYFLLPHYPGQGFGLFWGLTWSFFD